jgi:hypothetical protein
MSRMPQVLSISCLLWTVGLAGCGETNDSHGLPSATPDGGNDGTDVGPADAPSETAVPPDAGDAGCPELTCAGLLPLTACPMQAVCCPLQGTCDLPLDPTQCSWRLQGGSMLNPVEFLNGTSPVRRVEVDGGTTDVLPLQASEQDCASGGGWFTVRDSQGITVTLCPAECNEHLGEPGTAFVLERRWAITF